MQDRFKFRTYLSDLKFFKYWGWQEENHYIGLCACGDSSMCELLEKYTMQCTGLKDKNGKLIYEGDIIQFYIDDDDPYARSFVTMKIVWEDYELDFKAIGLNKNVECYKNDYQYLSCINIQQDELEVIGNIYENPELLEKKNE